jgi:hypothetical protein
MLHTEDTMIWFEEPLALDAPSSLDGDASYSDMVHGLFSDSPDEEAESLGILMTVISSSSPNEEHDYRETKYGDMLTSAMEALRSQVTNTTYKLHAQ